MFDCNYEPGKYVDLHNCCNPCGWPPKFPPHCDNCWQNPCFDLPNNPWQMPCGCNPFPQPPCKAPQNCGSFTFSIPYSAIYFLAGMMLSRNCC